MDANLPYFLAGEENALFIVRDLAEKYGYGNLIGHLQKAWSKRLQETGSKPLPKKTADMASGLICVWCKTDKRTGKKSK